MTVRAVHFDHVQPTRPQEPRDATPHDPYLTTTMGSAIAQGNCDPVYHGALLGYYDFGCNVARTLALPAAVRRDPVRTDDAKRRETPRRR